MSTLVTVMELVIVLAVPSVLFAAIVRLLLGRSTHEPVPAAGRAPVATRPPGRGDPSLGVRCQGGARDARPFGALSAASDHGDRCTRADVRGSCLLRLADAGLRRETHRSAVGPILTANTASL